MLIIKSEHIEAVIDSQGAQMQSLKLNGKEYLWQGSELYWTGRSPILFPIVGGLRNNLTVIDGRIYSMKRHGFARFSRFDTEIQEENSVIFSLCSSPETLAVYPFEFNFKVGFAVKGSTLTTEFTVENTGDKVMPFAIGGHPAINCPIDPDESFEDYAIQFECKENSDCPTVSMETGLIDFNNRYAALQNSDTINLKHSLFYQDAMIFDNLRSKTCKLYSKKSGRGVKLNFDGFKMLGIWSAVNDAPFICLEPWIGCATTADADDMFESKRDLICLQPGEAFKKSFTLELF